MSGTKLRREGPRTPRGAGAPWVRGLPNVQNTNIFYGFLRTGFHSSTEGSILHRYEIWD
jgi:hypothetical protein